MRLERLREAFPVGSPVKFTRRGASISGGWLKVRPDDIGVVVGYLPAGRFQGCQLIVDWGNDLVAPVFATQVENV